MYMNRNISRLLAAAVASAGFAVVPMPTFGATLTCTTATFNANTDGAGNIFVSCTPPGPTSVPSPPTNNPPPPTPPPTQNGGGPVTCTGYSKTFTLDLAWGAAGIGAPKVITTGFGNDSIVVARFTTPATSAVSAQAWIGTGEYFDQPTARSAALSTSPCDLTGTLGKYAAFNMGQQTPAVSYQINGAVPSRGSSYVVLQPSTTYYFNITNAANGAPTCIITSNSDTCNMIIELHKPSGL